MDEIPIQLRNRHQSDWCGYAAYHGNLDILQWAKSHGAPWDTYTCAYAARNGHLDILQWARANGAPWNACTCAYAAMYGHLNTLQWARRHGAPWDESTCVFAAENGHLRVLQWALAHGAPWSKKSILDRIELLQELRFRGVALVLFHQHRGTLETDLIAKMFVTTMYNILPLINPLCDLIINYC